MFGFRGIVQSMEVDDDDVPPAALQHPCSLAVGRGRDYNPCLRASGIALVMPESPAWTV